MRGILELYTSYEADVGRHGNQVPMIQYAGSTPARIGKGNTNIPKFKIVEWVDRPVDLPSAKGTDAFGLPPIKPESELNDKIEF